jgi:hypothetical protein
MRSRRVQFIFVWQILILMVFLGLTFTNEVLDLPHFLLGDKATTWTQRTGEISVEVIIFFAVIALEIYLFHKLIRRIRILEGFLPICASCKKIRTQDHWQQIENYISENSLVQFSHSLCPDCQKKLYPELFISKE